MYIQFREIKSNSMISNAFPKDYFYNHASANPREFSLPPLSVYAEKTKEKKTNKIKYEFYFTGEEPAAMQHAAGTKLCLNPFILVVLYILYIHTAMVAFNQR